MSVSPACFLRAVREWGVRKTFWKMYSMKVLKFGDLKGEDENGNQYFENTDYPYGQHRWVEHRDWESTQLAEASHVPPAWHPWLHCMTDETPTEFFGANGPLRTGAPLAEDVHTNVAHHVNLDHQQKHRVNPTLPYSRPPTWFGDVPPAAPGRKLAASAFMQHATSICSPIYMYAQPGSPVNARFKPTAGREGATAVAEGALRNVIDDAKDPPAKIGA